MFLETTLPRCPWVTKDPLYQKYHDDEWGVPHHDDRDLFELLTLEGMQAGLSWLTVLKKRENYRKAFDGFDAEKMALYEESKVKELLGNPGIIRNKRKINAAIRNARAFLKTRREFQTFDAYLWQFVGGKPKQNAWKEFKEMPCSSKQSDALSKDLIPRGFTFVGSKICYSFMQATGMVNDHTVDCFRHGGVAR